MRLRSRKQGSLACACRIEKVLLREDGLLMLIEKKEEVNYNLMQRELRLVLAYLSSPMIHFHLISAIVVHLLASDTKHCAFGIPVRP